MLSLQTGKYIHFTLFVDKGLSLSATAITRTRRLVLGTSLSQTKFLATMFRSLGLMNF